MTSNNFFHVSKGRYRRFGTPKQFKVWSAQEILDSIELYNRHKDCYLSIAEHEILESGVIINIPMFMPLDFDVGESTTIQDTLIDAEKVIDWLKSRGIAWQLDYSGFKGHHVIIPLRTTLVSNNIQFKAFSNYLCSELDLTTLDKHSVEIKRIIRIPGTMNMKSGKFCETLDSGSGKKLGLYEFTNNDSFSSPIEIKNRENATAECYFPHRADSPCIDSGVDNPEANHEVRWIWVKIMQARGYSFSEIVAKAKEKHWSDYNLSMTTYQVEYSMNSPAVISCSLVKSLGLCLGKRCPYKKTNLKE